MNDSPVAEEKKSKGFRFVPFSLTVVVLGLCLLIGMNLGTKERFPELTPGVYVGQISGVSEDRNQQHTLYIERLGKADAIVFVIFREGLTPQIIPLRFPSKSAREDGSLPIVLQLGDFRYTLHGRADRLGFSGVLTRDNETRGSWSLRTITAKELRSEAVSAEANTFLPGWLEARARYQRVRSEYDGLEKRTEEHRATLEKLERHLSVPDPLHARGEQRIEALDKQIESIEAEKESAFRALKDATRELEQLTRITRRGRAIDLSRRLAKREARWYQANWQEEEDFASVEQALAEKMNIDLRKLRETVRKAEELRMLRVSLSREKEMLRALQERYQRKVKEASKDDQEVPADNQQKQQPWWRRWDSVF